MEKYINPTQAYERGKQAFSDGLNAAAIHDTEFMDHCPFGDIGTSLPFLKAWDKGWHEANVDALVPGFTELENYVLWAARKANR